MIDAKTENVAENVTEQATPTVITTTMILNDLERGMDRAVIQAKYNLEPWEVKQMFMHPALKGKKVKKVKKLSFSFVDDTAQEEVDPNQTSIPMDEQDETQEKGSDHDVDNEEGDFGDDEELESDGDWEEEEEVEA